MKDYGHEYPVPSLPTSATIAAVLIMAVIIFVCQTMFLSRLADVASSPAAHSALSSMTPPSPSILEDVPSTPGPRGVAKLDDPGLLARVAQ